MYPRAYYTLHTDYNIELFIRFRFRLKNIQTDVSSYRVASLLKITENYKVHIYNFSERGCEEFVFVPSRLQHETLCKYRPVNCQFQERGCTQVYSLKVQNTVLSGRATTQFFCVGVSV